MQVYTNNKLPIKSWASVIDEGTLKQADDLANLPFVISHVALMPDAHVGYGMPIGGVLFTDKALVPYAVGVDIGCGVSLIKTENLKASDLSPQALKDTLHQIARDVPVGNGPRGEHKDSDIWHTDTIGESEQAFSIMDGAYKQLGTLGGGNHFIEIQKDTEDNIYVMLHSGSRSVGKKICDYHYKIAKDLNAKWHVDLPNIELSFLPFDSDEGQDYWYDMQAALAWAEENRRRMASKIISALGKYAKVEAWQAYDIHHNYAAWENHRGKNGIVHRKGAVRANIDETVLIPGSMGTASYIGRGLGNEESFRTCQHGAGRAMSRAAANKLWDKNALAKIMLDANVLMEAEANEAMDEAPGAYKDIEQVMEDSKDLVEPITRLTPLGVIKG